MKIYRFNPETGAFLGEDFADEVPMERGRYLLPPDATTIAPPRLEQGEVPMFNLAENRWEIRRIADITASPSLTP